MPVYPNNQPGFPRREPFNNTPYANHDRPCRWQNYATLEDVKKMNTELLAAMRVEVDRINMAIESGVAELNRKIDNLVTDEAAHANQFGNLLKSSENLILSDKIFCNQNSAQPNVVRPRPQIPQMPPQMQQIQSQLSQPMQMQMSQMPRQMSAQSSMQMQPQMQSMPMQPMPMQMNSSMPMPMPMQMMPMQVMQPQMQSMSQMNSSSIPMPMQMQPQMNSSSMQPQMQMQTQMPPMSQMQSSNQQPLPKAH